MRRLQVGLGFAFALAVMLAGTAAADSKKAPDGKPIFIKYKCGSCHSIASQGIEKKAVKTEEPAVQEKTGARKSPDLSSVGKDRKAAWIIAFLKKQEAIEGRKHMKSFRGTDAELATLAAWLETLKADKPESGDAPKK